MKKICHVENKRIRNKIKKYPQWRKTRIRKMASRKNEVDYCPDQQYRYSYRLEKV